MAEMAENGPKMGRKCAENDRNWSKMGQSATGGYTDPKKKHGFVEVAEIQTLFSPIFEKKVRIPPRRMVQRGENPHFFLKIGENGVWISATFLKKWPKRGVPPFWVIFGYLGPKWPNQSRIRRVI